MMNNKKLGVLYYTFGNNFPSDLERSVKSIRKTNPNLEICWITEIPNHPKKNLFDYIIKSKSKKKIGWHKRTESFLLTPFDITLYLDSDTIVLGDLSYGFEKANNFSIALCHAPAYNSGLFIPNTSNKSLKPFNNDQPVYNAGVIFYKNDEKFYSLIEKWNFYNSKCKTMQDQGGGLSNAIEDLNINPFILTKAWNFRHSYTEGHGNIKIWHSSRNFPSKTNFNGFFKIKY